MARQKLEKPQVHLKAESRILLLFCVLVLSRISCFSTTPTPACDEQIEDKDLILESVLSYSEIEELSSLITIGDVVVSNCYVDGIANICVPIEVPPQHSIYGFRYTYSLNLGYSAEGELSIASTDHTKSDSINPDEVVQTIFDMIEGAESNPRISEFFEKLGMNLINEPVRLDEGVTRYDVEQGWIEYDLFDGFLQSYSIPNTIHWREFPEIDQAHVIIEEELLIGDRARCVVGRGDLHSYTILSFHYFQEDPLGLTVALDCEGEWAEAFIKLRSDGTYERLEFRE